jgi:hypothetical protein
MQLEIKNDMLAQKQYRNTETWSSSPPGEGLRVRFSACLIIISLLIVISCNRKPFVDHKLKFERLSDNCQNLRPSFRVVSNIAGERYEFEKCLSSDFTKDMMNVSRQGDTVLVQFQKPATQSTLYKITLDIDSYPKYNFITVDGETFIVTSSKD